MIAAAKYNVLLNGRRKELRSQVSKSICKSANSSARKEEKLGPIFCTKSATAIETENQVTPSSHRMSRSENLRDRNRTGGTEGRREFPAISHYTTSTYKREAMRWTSVLPEKDSRLDFWSRGYTSPMFVHLTIHMFLRFRYAE